jgi:hypothetical protein
MYIYRTISAGEEQEFFNRMQKNISVKSELEIVKSSILSIFAALAAESVPLLGEAAAHNAPGAAKSNCEQKKSRKID